MPTINVTERKVTPKLDRGLVAGLYFGGVTAVWLLLIGALSGDAAAPFHTIGSFVLGDAAFDEANRLGDFFVGLVVHLIGAAIDGVLFALAWPWLRKYGTWTPSVAFILALTILTYEFIGRIFVPGLGEHINDFAFLSAAFLGGLVLAYRYRRA